MQKRSPTKFLGLCNKQSKSWEWAGRETAQRLRGHTALAEDPSSLTGTHVRWFTEACNSSARASDTPGTTDSCTHTHTPHAHTPQFFKKALKFFEIIKESKNWNFLRASPLEVQAEGFSPRLWARERHRHGETEQESEQERDCEQENIFHVHTRLTTDFWMTLTWLCAGFSLALVWTSSGNT